MEHRHRKGIKRPLTPVGGSESVNIDSCMKLLSSFSSTVSASRVSFCRAALFVSIIGGLLMAPTLSYAQNSHKPTAKHFKPVVDDTAPPQVEAGVQPSNEAPESISGPAISPSVITTTIGPAWTALGPAPI